MTYWEYRKEKAKESLENLVEWWREWDLLFLLFTPIFILICGFSALLVSAVETTFFIPSVILIGIGGIWLIVFVGVVLIDSERVDYIEWKAKREKKNTGERVL